MYQAFANPSSAAQVEWSFSKLSTGISPLSILRCEMKRGKDVVYGYSESFGYKHALKVSFSEAWERMCMLDYSFSESDHSNSNGFAAGRSSEDASNRAVAELVERATVLTAWYTMSGWTPYQSKGIINNILLHIEESKGWDFSFFELKETKYGSTLACLGQHKTYGAIFDCSFLGKDRDKISAIESKLVKSIVKSSLVRRKNPPARLDSFAECGGPNLQDAYYSETDNLQAFSFLEKKTSRQGTIELAYGVEPSVEIVSSSDGVFPFVARASHPTWPTLSWGKSSIKGKNKWPHPLA
jgi:hypothetical protein